MSSSRLVALGALLVAACASPPSPITPAAPSSSSSVTLTLAADAADELANPPRVDDAAHKLDGRTADVQAALDAARAKLKTLPRYRSWQSEKSRYDSTVGINDKGHLVVLFNPPDVTDQEITIEVDLATKAVVDVRMGMA